MTAQKGAETFKENAQKIKTEAEKSEVGKQAYKVAEDTFKTPSSSGFPPKSQSSGAPVIVFGLKMFVINTAPEAKLNAPRSGAPMNLAMSRSNLIRSASA